MTFNQDYLGNCSRNIFIMYFVYCRNHHDFRSHDRREAECVRDTAEHVESGAEWIPHAGKQEQHRKRASLKHGRSQVRITSESVGHCQLPLRSGQK